MPTTRAKSHVHLGLMEWSLRHPSHSTCRSLWQWSVRLWYRSVGGHFTAEIVELKADFAATSACSLPRITNMTWNPTRSDGFSRVDQLAVVRNKFLHISRSKMAIVNGHQTREWVRIWQISYALTAGLYQVPSSGRRVLLWKCWLCL